MIINANWAADNYWFHIGVGTDCGYNTILSSDIKVGVIFYYDGASDAFYYDGASDAELITTGVTLKTSYINKTTLTPWISNTVPSAPL